MVADYASVVFAGFTAISAGWYFIRGRKAFTGPPVVVADVAADAAAAPATTEGARPSSISSSKRCQ